MVHGSRRNAKKMRNSRCKSADSGVSCTLNKNLIQQNVVQSSRFEFNDLNEEDLDFEPELTDDIEEQPHNLINSDESTLNLIYSDGRDGDSYSNASDDNYSISTLSMGHRREMLPVPHSDAEDGRQSEYLPFTCSSTTRTIIDSSSDETSSESTNDDNGRSASEGDLSRDQNNSYSSNLDLDAREDMLNMTQEEEDRLLDSNNEYATDAEEEESHIETELTEAYDSRDDAGKDNNTYLETESVETCQIGNARITLPKFFKNNTPVDALRPRGNDLKRTTSTAKSHKMPTRKKKRWDLHYTPDVPPTRLFLEDLGFVAESSSDEDDNDDITSDSVKSVPQLIVICNDKEKVVCETNKNEMQSFRENLQIPKTENNVFKMPLPPPKRPPTRPKRTFLNSENSGKNLQIEISNKDARLPQQLENSFNTRGNDFSIVPQNFGNETKCNTIDITDDSISLCASTIGDNNEDASDVSLIECKESSIFDPERLFKYDPEPPLRNFSFAEERVQNWVQNVPDPDPLPMIQPEVMQPQFRMGTATTIPPLAAIGNNRFYFGDVPNIFTGLCYYHFFNMNCTKKCNHLHCVPRAKYTHRFQQHNPEVISKAYEFALRFEKLFNEIYPCFMETFAFFKMQKKLVTCIEDILKIDSISKTEALEIIVSNLENSGLSFLETIEMITFNIGLLQYPELGDILLDLITRKNSISENWDVIKRIGRARGQISPNIVKRILTRVTSVYPLNKPLCLEIYNVIIRNEMTDLSQISEEHLAPLRTLAGFRENADGSPKQAMKVSPSNSLIGSITIPHNTELLAAHIDNNLIKERERYEKAVESRTVRITNNPINPTEIEGTYVNSYGYDSRNATMNYDNFRRSSDSDDRYFMPKPMHEPFMPRDSTLTNDRFSNQYMEGALFSAASSSTSNDGVECGTNSPGSRMLFEPPPPPEVTQYVPETIRKNIVRSETTRPRNLSPPFTPPRNLPPLRYQDTDITLTPSRPIFGNPCYRNGFVLDKSLHNLLSDTVEHVNINEKDIAVLNNAIKSKNGAEFYRLLEQYKSPATLQNFITMTIAHLKSSNELYEVLMGLVESLEKVRPTYAKEKHIKAVIEVVVMNLLFEFERKCLWFRARELLEKFCDWDSLISSQLFQIFSMRKVTTMGRYIFLAKIFTKSQNLHYTYEILQCPSLHLLESCEHWPYFYNVQADVKQRNTVLTEFIKNGARHSVVNVSDLYRRVYRYSGIHGYDAHQLFNPMLISIINDNQISNLKYFHQDIDVYYKVMDKNVLRAFTIVLFSQLAQDELYRLYEFCCERQIYTLFQGGETNITVRNNMRDEELQLILNYYFYKVLRTRRLPAGNLIINIKLLENQVVYPRILNKYCRSIHEVNESVKQILRTNFNIYVTNSTNTKLTDIEIKLEQIEGWLRANDIYCHQGYW